MRTPAVLAALLTFLLLPACAARAAEQFQPAQLREFGRAEISVERQHGRDTFKAWLAVTGAQQQQGLMWIRTLPADYGMLFLLETPRPMDMWMKNTYVPLDMLFFDPAGRITHIHRNAVPHSEELISSRGDVAGVLEIAGGEADRRGIRPGDRIGLPKAAARQ